MSLSNSEPLSFEPQPPHFPSPATPEPAPESEPEPAPRAPEDEFRGIEPTEGAPAEPEIAAPSAPEETPARRRRARRRAVPIDLERRSAFFRELIHQATPSIDFFLFSIIAGVVAGTALVLDSPALFFLAALLAPFMAPVLGIALSSAVGSLGLFVRSLIALAIGSGLVFGLGALSGWVSLSMTGLAFSQAVFHTTFTWPDLVAVLLGAIFTAYLAVRSPQQRPLVSSVALAYELFLPLSAAGFGLIHPIPGLFPEGLILFASSLALAVVIAAFVLVALGVRPLGGGATLASLVLVLVLVGAALFGIGNVVLSAPDLGPLGAVIPPSPTPTLTPTLVPSLTDTPAPSATVSPLPSGTPTRTLVPTATTTITFTPSPTPVYGLVNAGDLAKGIIIRPDPSSLQIVTTLLNGSLVEILPEVVNKNGFLWIHVRAPDGQEGWVLAGSLVTATPRP